MKKLFFALAVLFGATSLSVAQQMPNLPLDPSVKVGKLDNGMTYYIRHNALPEKRCEFYLATNVGAIQETPDQDGLAHFLEHMCFNGTKNFPGKSLLDWLQSIGASFGGNINASTGIEQTQYMLNNIPVIRESIVDSCLLVMHDYSHFVTLDPKEIDAERGVILEEKRTRNNAGWRTYMESKKYLYKGSKYAECSLIGSEENLKTFKPSSIENFYHTWYRPDMQALIVVGDIDVNDIEARVKRIFADIPAAVNPKAKDVIKVPENKEPIVGIVTDKETTNTSVEVYWKSDPTPREYNNTPIALMGDLIKRMARIIMNERISDIAAKPGAPFIDGGFGIYNICTTVESVIAEASSKDGESLPALEAILTEAEKMARFGFTDDEVARAKTEILSQYESAAKKADTRKNSEFIRPIISNFFNNDYMLDPKMAYQIVQSVLPQLNTAAVNQAVKGLITKENMVVLVSAPEKAGLVNPTEQQVLDVIAKVAASDIKPNVVETVPTAFLDASKLKGAAVKSRTAYRYGSEEVILSNGVKVIFKPTDKEKDRISFELYKKGGCSIVSNADLYNVEKTVYQLFNSNSGLSKFSKTTVDKMLSGKQCGVSPFIRDYTHGISGHSTCKDLETALQMAYLSFADPRFDQDEYNQGINQLKAVLPNMVGQPNYKLQQELYKTIYNNPRKFIVSEESMAKASLKGLEKVYRSLFKDASGATMVIVGDFKTDEILPLVQKYIGSIRKGGKATNWKNNSDGILGGNALNDFRAVMTQPKVTVLQVYKVEKPYSVQAEVDYEALSYILDMVYTETLREEEGGTYGASANDQCTNAPDEFRMIQVYFDTNEEKADKLRALAKDGIRKLAEEGPTAEQFDRTIRNLEKKIPEKRLRNSYWMSSLKVNNLYGYDYDTEYEAAVKALTPERIKAAAAEVLGGGLRELVMRPQK